MSQVAEIQVAHLYQAGEYQGKATKAKLVAHDGTKYSCEDSQLAQFREGEKCAIYYSDESFTNKKTGELVKYKKLVSTVAQTNGSVQKNYTKPSMNPADARGAFVTVILEAYV